MKVQNIICLSLVILAGCSSAPRTKWTDKSMRVMIDPDSIDEENYVQIQRAIVGSGKFTVVDRARGMKAMKKEQERTQRTEEDRFADKEKWSHWGKMYGVGSIIVAHVQCRQEHATFNRTKFYLDCRQLLAMVDSNTGEVFVAVEGRNDGPSSYDLSYMVPDWDETTEKLMSAYPKHYKDENYSKEVLVYQDLSDEHAKRQRELQEKSKEPSDEVISLRNKVRDLESRQPAQSSPLSLPQLSVPSLPVLPSAPSLPETSLAPSTQSAPVVEAPKQVESAVEPQAANPQTADNINPSEANKQSSSVPAQESKPETKIAENNGKGKE